MYYIYPNKKGNPAKDPIAKAPTDLKARHECAKLMNRYPGGLWAEDKAAHKFFLMEHFGNAYLYTNNDGVERRLDSKGNVIKKKVQAVWRPFGL